MRRNRNQTAFSLVEILVVVSTTAVLVGVLLPSLGAARQQAKKTVCLSNVRQMVIAAQSYTSDNDEHYPVAYTYPERRGDIAYQFAWDFTTLKDWSTSPATEHVEPGLLWSGQRVEKIQQCPAFKGSSNALADPYTGYNYNTSYIGLNDRLSPYNSARTTEVHRPAETALFGDGQATDGGANKYMRAPFPHPGDTLLPDSARHAGAQGYRHLGQTNVAFCDGHARPWKEMHTETDPAAREVLEDYNRAADVPVGFLTKDNDAYDLK